MGTDTEFFLSFFFLIFFFCSRHAARASTQPRFNDLPANGIECQICRRVPRREQLGCRESDSELWASQGTESMQLVLSGKSEQLTADCLITSIWQGTLQREAFLWFPGVKTGWGNVISPRRCRLGDEKNLNEFLRGSCRAQCALRCFARRVLSVFFYAFNELFLVFFLLDSRFFFPHSRQWLSRARTLHGLFLFSPLPFLFFLFFSSLSLSFTAKHGRNVKHSNSITIYIKMCI